ncbi:hypothetical protein OIU35_00515 [Boseaceae bacterium BT-24-1]|nr:hypothetical protein [Boseaceae bacterium BT-24-1]
MTAIVQVQRTPDRGLVLPVAGMGASFVVEKAVRTVSGVDKVSVPPIFAALAMALSSVSVLTNALRLRRFSPPTAADAAASAQARIAAIQ